MKRAMLAWCALAGVLLVSAAHAAEPEAAAPELTLTPSEVSLASGEATRVVAVVQAGREALSDVVLEATEVPGLSVTAAGASWPEIEPGGFRAVDLLVERDGGSAAALTVPLRLGWREGPADDEGDRKLGILVQSLGVGIANRPMSGVAELTIESAIETIEDRRHGGMAYAVVKNLTSQPLTVTDVRCYAPYFLDIRYGKPEPAQPTLWISTALAELWDRLTERDEPEAVEGTGGGDGQPWSCGQDLPLPTVEAGSSRALPFQVTADVVEPGKHTVVWEVELAWQRAGEERHGVAVASHDFTLGVLGESELLQLFAWPSILVLPGALMVLTFVTLRKRIWPRSATGLSATDAATKAEFWLIAVALSFLAAIFYPWLTGKLGDPRDFIVVHGLDDLVNLWLGSVLAALIAWALWYGGKLTVGYTLTSLRLWRERRTLPQPQDNPLQLLGKLRRAGRPELVVEVVELQNREGSPPALLLFDLGDEGAWVGPPMEVVCRTDATREDLGAVRDDPDQLLPKLRAALGSGNVTQVRWKSEDRMPRWPERVAPGAFVRPGGTRRLVVLTVRT